MTVISAISGALLITILCEASALVLPNSTDLFLSTKNYTDVEAALRNHLDSASLPKVRKKRYISQNDMITILDFHNQVRGKVFPPASNMEYMVSSHVFIYFTFLYFGFIHFLMSELGRILQIKKKYNLFKFHIAKSCFF